MSRTPQLPVHCTALPCMALTGAIVVIAANAGGAWTPIGDVTTTMLWIGGQVLGLVWQELQEGHLSGHKGD